MRATATHGRHGTHPPHKSDLSAGRRRLIEWMQKVNFGRLETLVVRDHQPDFDAPPTVVHEVKFGGENGPRVELRTEDFLLKSQVVELFARLDELRDGVIDVLEIKHGLPFRMLIRATTV